MIQKIVLAFLLFGFSFLAKADLVYISCNTAAGGVISSVSEQCSSGGITGTTASALDKGAADYFVTAQNNALSGVVDSTALIAGDLTLLVLGGTGTAWLVPCLSVNGQGSASLGTMGFGGAILTANGNTCTAPALSDGIQITFGTPVSGEF